MNIDLGPIFILAVFGLVFVGLLMLGALGGFAWLIWNAL